MIAIDGPSGSGKSSTAREVARRLGLGYLDTGAMYRAVTYEALERKLTDDDAIADMAAKLDMEVIPKEDTMHVIVDGKDVTPFIRTPEVSSHVSAVSAIAGVRSAMTAIQRKLGEKGGIVLDGRDIGTTVLPHADVKIFLTASVHTRAIRRFKELTEGHPDMTMEDVEKEISRRDYLDSHREISPLKQADDAVLLDNGDLTLEGTAEAIIAICRKKFPDFA